MEARGLLMLKKDATLSTTMCAVIILLKFAPVMELAKCITSRSAIISLEKFALSTNRDSEYGGLIAYRFCP